MIAYLKNRPFELALSLILIGFIFLPDSLMATTALENSWQATKAILMDSEYDAIRQLMIRLTSFFYIIMMLNHLISGDSFKAYGSTTLFFAIAIYLMIGSEPVLMITIAKIHSVTSEMLSKTIFMETSSEFWKLALKVAFSITEQLFNPQMIFLIIVAGLVASGVTGGAALPIILMYLKGKVLFFIFGTIFLWLSVAFMLYCIPLFYNVMLGCFYMGSILSLPFVVFPEYRGNIIRILSSLIQLILFPTILSIFLSLAFFAIGELIWNMEDMADGVFESISIASLLDFDVAALSSLLLQFMMGFILPVLTLILLNAALGFIVTALVPMMIYKAWDVSGKAISGSIGGDMSAMSKPSQYKDGNMSRSLNSGRKIAKGNGR